MAFAKVPCAEFEVRNDWYKSAINALEKITVTDDGSNNLGVEPPEAKGVWRQSLNTGGILQFLSKNKAFYAYFGLNFCLETCFK